MTTPIKLNGCYNRLPLRTCVTVQDGWVNVPIVYDNVSGRGITSRVAKMKTIDNPMTKDCQYTLTTPDPRCSGCIHEHKRELVTAEKVLALRDKLGVPMVYAKEALTRCKGDPEQAEQYLRTVAAINRQANR